MVQRNERPCALEQVANMGLRIWFGDVRDELRKTQPAEIAIGDIGAVTATLATIIPQHQLAHELGLSVSAITKIMDMQLPKGFDAKVFVERSLGIFDRVVGSGDPRHYNVTALADFLRPKGGGNPPSAPHRRP